MALTDYVSPIRHPESLGATPLPLKKSKNRPQSEYHHRQPFSVVSQLISIDVDLPGCSISGSTEITIAPTNTSIKIVRVDARYMEIKGVLVNDRPAKYLYNDKLGLEDRRVLDIADPDVAPAVVAEAVAIEKYTINQHHAYKSHFKRIYDGESSNESKELIVFLPDKMKITLTDSGSVLNAFSPAVRDSPGSYRTPTFGVGDTMYTPISIKIEYTCKNPCDGLSFVGGLHRASSVPPEQWHAFTSHSLIGVSASSWVPCIDNLWERCVWRLEITTPRTVGSMMGQQILEDPEKDNAEEKELKHATDREIMVCVSDLFNPKEEINTLDPSKKTTSFSIINAVSAHNLGWAVGAFERFPLYYLEDDESEAEEEEEEEEDEGKDSTAVKGFIYSFPEDKEDALNTCLAVSKAVDFFARDFGSFPFSSYSIFFAKNPPHSSYSFSGLTIHSTKLLYGPKVIDKLFDNTEILVAGLAKQWSGVNVLPRNYEDFWITIGIQYYMTDVFMKRLVKTNESKFRLKKRSEHLCQIDIGKPSIGDPLLSFPVNENSDLEFIKLKAPLVFFILNRRMVKTDKSLGLRRVIQKIFLEAMSDELPSIDTPHFQHVAEKVNHNKLDSFFRQWVYSSGTPIFRVTQRFNKKRMFIEMGIRQVQADEVKPREPTVKSFVDDAQQFLEYGTTSPSPAVFTGPMTIRVHEADGTPYEHIVNLKEGFTKLDIQYNTKYKRLKRRFRQDGEKNGDEEEEDEEAKEDEDGDYENSAPKKASKYCFGNVLQSEADVKKWGLVDWTDEDEEKMNNEAFEWIRLDVDCEWLCKIYFDQPDYMYAAQLQQDRDVEAQFESIRYFAETPKPIPVYATILLRTLMDSRYYYGVRIEAAKALVAYATKNFTYLGMRLLIKAFQTLFCFDVHSNIPLPNDFSDFQSYFIQKAFPKVLATIKDDTFGGCLMSVKAFLLDLLRYNENSQNEFIDSFYVGELIESLVYAILENDVEISIEIDAERKKAHDNKNVEFLNKVLMEFDRLMRMDEWMPSYGRIVSSAILKSKIKLALHGYLDLSYEDLLAHLKPGNHDEIRIVAISGIFSLGGLKNTSFLRYLFKLLELDPSSYLKHQIVEKLYESIGEAGVKGTLSILDDEEFEPDDVFGYTMSDLSTLKTDKVGEGPQDDGEEVISDPTMFVIEEEEGNEGMNERKTAISRTTVGGIMELLRREYGSKGTGIRTHFWEALRSPVLGIEIKKSLFQLCSILIEPIDAVLVTLPLPRDKNIVAKHNGNGVVVVFRQNKLKIQFNKKLALKILSSSKGDRGSSSKSPRTPINRTLTTKLIDEFNDEDGSRIVLKTPVASDHGSTAFADFKSAYSASVHSSELSLKNTVVVIKSGNKKEIPVSAKKGKTKRPKIKTDSNNSYFEVDDSATAGGKDSARYVKINFKAHTIRLAGKPFKDSKPAVKKETIAKTLQPGKASKPKLKLKFKPK